MRIFLATSALAFLCLGQAALAQSVLERVLSSISSGNSNMKPVTGTFANIAENVAVLGGGDTETQYYINGDWLTETQARAFWNDVAVPAWTNENGTLQAPTVEDPTWHIGTLGQAGYQSFATQDAGRSYVQAAYKLQFPFEITFQTRSVQTTPLAILNSIDGSVSNVVTGVGTATADVAGRVQAVEQVTVDIANVSTTVLGAVNTGTTTLGVNSEYHKAATRRVSVVSGKVRELGGIAGQTALVLNVASNATSVTGAVANSFTGLNGSVGNIGTTVLGAVNTGTISSGVSAVSNGVVAGIVGHTTL